LSGIFNRTDVNCCKIVLAYEQMWGSYVANTGKAFKALVYAALND